MTGTLYVVSTPIGNPADLSFRALRILQESSLIVAEHPSVTRALLDRLAVTTPVTSYGTDEGKLGVLLDRLRAGESLAVVCDAGTPALWDPGAWLIERAHAQNIPVRPIPGPSALLAAIAATGRGGDGFTFLGALPGGAARRDATFTAIVQARRPVVLFLRGSQLRVFLAHAARKAPSHLVWLVIDATGPRERIRRGTATELLARRGRVSDEVTVVMEPGKRRRSEGRARATGRRVSG